MNGIERILLAAALQKDPGDALNLEACCVKAFERILLAAALQKDLVDHTSVAGYGIKGDR